MGCAVLAGLLGCTVGDGNNATLSGGASASAGEGAETLAPSTGDDSSSGHGSEGASDDAASMSGGASTADDDAASAASSGSSDDGGDAGSDTGGSTGTGVDGSSSGSSGGELDDGILDITIIAHDDCTFTVMPASITVPEGTEFTVNWISAASSAIELDIAKIDPFNQVPIIIGMEPGTAYHDEVRTWCGALFTGTFDFRLTSCFDPTYIPVDCGG